MTRVNKADAASKVEMENKVVWVRKESKVVLASRDAWVCKDMMVLRVASENKAVTAAWVHKDVLALKAELEIKAKWASRGSLVNRDLRANKDQTVIKDG